MIQWKGVRQYETVGGCATIGDSGRVCDNMIQWEGVRQYETVGGCATRVDLP